MQMLHYAGRVGDRKLIMETNRKDKGFTLIELLVVIAIIALLLAILSPALSSAKRSAQTLICGTNLKSYGPALNTYAMDNKDKAPFMVSWLFSQKTVSSDPLIPKECMWHNDRNKPDGSLWPYLSTKNVHMCPTFKGYAVRGGKEGCPFAAKHSMMTPFGPTYSYAMNWFLGFDWEILLQVGDAEMLAKEISLKVSKVKLPGQCFSFSEENPWTIEHRDQDRDGKIYSANALNDNALWMNANKDKPDGAIDNMATYHNVSDAKRNEGKANVLFVDGHVGLTLGEAGREAYLKFAKPYPGHEKMNVW
jgi:prepilin-type N-terminal cleavage/methylation domain-containing protein/prepilin-type processing-associated H-X9-DG protein